MVKEPGLRPVREFQGKALFMDHRNLSRVWVISSHSEELKDFSLETDQSILCYLVLLVLLAIEWLQLVQWKSIFFSQATHSYGSTISLLQREYPQHERSGISSWTRCAHSTAIAASFGIGITDWHRNHCPIHINSAIPIWGILSVHARGHSSLTHSLSHHTHQNTF